MPHAPWPERVWDFSNPNPDPGFWGGYQVLDDSRGLFVDAPESDQRLIRDYPFWIDKGPLLDHTRATLMTAKLQYAVGEAVRVAHIVEETGVGRTLYPVGPKAVRDEFLNGIRVTAATPDPGDYPWLPDSYDGDAFPSPGIDYNFEITEYQFANPGDYRIQWRPGRFRSNILVVTTKAMSRG